MGELKGKTLLEVSTGPTFTIWIAFAIILIISVILLTGRGAGLISGYNRKSPMKKAQYNAKKLCRVNGAGLLVVAILLLVMGLFQAALPATFIWVAMGIIIADSIAMTVLSMTICKR